MKGAAALSGGNYRKNSDFSQYSSRLFLETESRRPVSHKALSPRVHAWSARLGDIPVLSCVSIFTHTHVCAPTAATLDFLVSRNRPIRTLSRTRRIVLFLLPPPVLNTNQLSPEYQEQKEYVSAASSIWNLLLKTSQNRLTLIECTMCSVFLINYVWEWELINSNIIC